MKTLKTKLLLVLLLMLTNSAIFAQSVGINTTGNVADASSMLDVNASDKGVLIPRVSLQDVNNSTSPINAPANGLLVYNTNAGIVGGYGTGFYYWAGAWTKIITAPSDDLFIRNQNTNDQSANFRITGIGRMNTSVQSPIYTRADAGTVGVRPNANSITAIQLQDASGAAVLDVDASNARIGIGTNAPLAKLHIINSSNTDGIILQNNNGGAGTATNISFTGYGDAVPGISRPGARISGIDDGSFSAHLSFLTKVPGADANLLTERIRILSSGNVGIGTANATSLLHVGANEGDGITIGKPDDAMGFNGGSYSIRFYGYRDVVTNAIAAKISAERTNVCCGYLSQGTDLAFYTNAGLVTNNADNSIERMRIRDNGNVTIANLAGTGNRPVLADATGTLKAAGSKGVAFSQNRTEFTIDTQNLGYRNVGTATGNLAVETGDIIVINVTMKFRWNGGSGGDHPRFGIAVTGCATASIDDTYYHRTADDTPRNEYQTVAYQYVYTATCTGNLQFNLRADTNSDGDDNSSIGDLVIVATRY